MGRVVESHRLPRCDAALGLVEANGQPVVRIMREHAAHGGTMGAALGDGVAALGPDLVHPGDGMEIDTGGIGRLGWADQNPTGAEVDGGDVPAPAVVAVAHAPALAHGDELQVLDRAQIGPGVMIDQASGMERQPVAQDGVVPARREPRLLYFGGVC